MTCREANYASRRRGEVMSRRRVPRKRGTSVGSNRGARSKTERRDPLAVSQSAHQAPCNSEQRAPVAGGYTRFMFTENTKTLLFIAWSIVIFLAAIAVGIGSVSNWVVVACVAVVPPLVVRYFWRAPEQTISESINEARR